MDNFRVPRKVNRHVLKAISYLAEDSDDDQYVAIEDIKHQVKYSMRNLIPVPQLDDSILASLRNLTILGVLTTNTNGTCYAIRKIQDMLIKPEGSYCQENLENELLSDWKNCLVFKARENIWET